LAAAVVVEGVDGGVGHVAGLARQDEIGGEATGRGPQGRYPDTGDEQPERDDHQLVAEDKVGDALHGVLLETRPELGSVPILVRAAAAVVGLREAIGPPPQG